MERSDVQLKHLGFVRALAINAAVVVSTLYCYAKENSGSLKSAVGKVENAVSAAAGPVYDKFKGVPGDILVFLDKKVSFFFGFLLCCLKELSSPQLSLGFSVKLIYFF